MIATACDRPWLDHQGDTDLAFPQGTHSLLPPDYGDQESKVAVSEFVPDVNDPDPQPLEFNHKIHASSVEDGGLGMDCQYCHSVARQSIHAGVPPLQTCEGCHKMISTEGRPVLEELKGYIDRQEAIPWNKVHDLPDFVHFDHSAHVADAGIECQECHGPMEERGVAVQVSELNMGWCLDCHRDHPSVNENYATKADLRRSEMKDCYTCHK